MANSEEVKDIITTIKAINTIKSMCRKKRKVDNQDGNLQCVDCPIYQIYDFGYLYCPLTENEEQIPKYW